MGKRRRKVTGSGPPKGSERVAAQLFSGGGQRKQFLDSLSVREKPTLISAVWTKGRQSSLATGACTQNFFGFPSVALYENRSEVLDSSEHQTGEVYLLDPSSVFMGAAIPLELLSESRLVIDVCAAPGGKSLLASAHRGPQTQLIANEKVPSRASRLIANFERCQVSQAAVSRVDPRILGEGLRAVADIVLVDAPCSGQSLLAKAEENPGAFHPVNIRKNVGRQRRILAEAAKLVRPGGVLVYMTCTFSIEENEGNLEWFVTHFPSFVPQEVCRLSGFESSFSALPCYRLFPFQNLGVGGFTALCYHKNKESNEDLPGRVMRYIWQSSDFVPPDGREMGR